jgi:hypothetical protein
MTTHSDSALSVGGRWRQTADGGTRPVSRRPRHMLARWRQHTAKRGGRGDPLDRGHEALQCDRVRSVRRQLRDIALLLERSTDPDPRAVAELHRLSSDACESPLFNAAVYESELRAMLHTPAEQSRPASSSGELASRPRRPFAIHPDGTWSGQSSASLIAATAYDRTNTPRWRPHAGAARGRRFGGFGADRARPVSARVAERRCASRVDRCPLDEVGGLSKIRKAKPSNGRVPEGWI